MDLRNTLPHMRNTTVLVNGNRYTVVNGLATGVQEQDAKKLLANPAWQPLAQKVERTPVVEAPQEPELTKADEPTNPGFKVQNSDDPSPVAKPRSRRGRRATA